MFAVSHQYLTGTLPISFLVVRPLQRRCVKSASSLREILRCKTVDAVADIEMVEQAALLLPPETSSVELASTTIRNGLRHCLILTTWEM
jgi:hypothetical protein